MLRSTCRLRVFEPYFPRMPQCRTDYKILYNVKALISWITFSQLGAFGQRKLLLCTLFAHRVKESVCVRETERERQR